MKTSIIQFQPAFADIPSNTKKVSGLLNNAIGAELVVIPELANSGYNFKDKEQAFSLASSPEKSAFVDMLVEHARDNNQHIVSGFHEKEENRLYNTSLLISKDGIIGKYRKVHLFMNEKSIFEPGNLGFPVFKINEFKIGMLICFDYLFAEAWRIMGLKGADIIAHPSNLLTENAFKVVPAQALMNRYFVVTANRTGTEREITFNGKSFAVDPGGNLIDRAEDDSERILTFEIDPNLSKDKLITPLNHVFEDRFPDKYSELI